MSRAKPFDRTSILRQLLTAPPACLDGVDTPSDIESRNGYVPGLTRVSDGTSIGCRFACEDTLPALSAPAEQQIAYHEAQLG